ncbi:E-selectin [Ictalurus punctatus]|uniref:E-selectin n=1 Tax=Ictalurus punctatus TaxID=7998 RepID=A0A2D0Q1H5_ICTPU|nr:E-selectin [Ictalurus punctatus]
MDFYNAHVSTISTVFILLFSMLNRQTGVEGWSYHPSNTTMDWTTARDWCMKHYTNMVAIQNHGEIEYLNDQFPKVAGHYWIGIRKINSTWTWVGTGKHLTAEAENWAKGEPNNGRNNEDCVEIYIKRPEDEGKWNDESCQKKKTALCYTASCKKDSCSYNGECVETINSHRCDCFEGFYGVKCEHVVKCEAKEISAPEHGGVQCRHPNGDFSYKSECEYSCEEGYQLVGAKTAQCGGTQAWSNKPPTCELIQCFKLNMILHGNIQCNHPLQDFSYQSSCVFSCDEGYTLTGSSSSWLTCNPSGHWNDSQPSCEAVRCPTLEEPVDGKMSCIGDSYGSRCMFSCNVGFQLLGMSELTCTKTAQWSQETPSCKAVQCPALQTPQDGSVSCTDQTLSLGSICSFTCGEGFILEGASSTKCTEIGEWSTSVPSCTAVQCPALQTPQDGSVSCTDQTLSLGSICSFTCGEGFILEGASSTKCTETGEWSTSVPSCTAVQCPALQTPQNGSVSCTDQTLSLGSICSFTCGEGFILEGASSTKCTETGEWSTSVPSCTAVGCPYLQEPINGLINCSSEEAVFSTSCSFSCLSGYQLHGHNIVMCNLNGNWTGEVPECQAHPVSLSPTLVSGLTVGVGCTTAFSSIAFAFWILKRLRKLKANKFDLSNSDIDVPHQVYKSSADSLI